MSKKTTKQAPAVTYSITDRVIVKTAATLHEPATGTVVDISKTGWYIVQLDESNAPNVLANTKGKVSARISSMEPLTIKPKMGSFAAQLASANGTGEAVPQPPAKPKAAPKPKKAEPKLPTECPECESGELEVETDEDGNTTVSCSCGWEETIEADKEAATRMAEALKKAREHYKKDKRPDGSATAHCNDAIAKELHDLDPKEVADLADKVLKQPHGFHFGKYQNLNNGQIRMNSGNRIRAYWKKINEEADEGEKLRVAKLLNLVEVDDDEEEANKPGEIMGEEVDAIEAERDGQ